MLLYKNNLILHPGLNKCSFFRDGGLFLFGLRYCKDKLFHLCKKESEFISICI